MNSLIENFKELNINFFSNPFSDFLSVGWFIERFLLIIVIAFLYNKIFNHLIKNSLDRKKVIKLRSLQNSVNSGLKLAFIITSVLGVGTFIFTKMFDFSKYNNGFNFYNLLHNMTTLSVVDNVVISIFLFVLLRLLGTILEKIGTWNTYVSEDYHEMINKIFGHYTYIFISCKVFSFFLNEIAVAFFIVEVVAITLITITELKTFHRECF